MLDIILSLPLVTSSVTSGIGPRSTSLGQDYHKGLDLACKTGTSVLSATSGTVTRSGPVSGGYGNLVEVQTGSYLVRYAHNSQVYVSPGDPVEPGQTIAACGSSGRTTGPHLHFEIRLKGAPVNPGLPSSW